jgi:two-component system sensor histidine kinase CpxA
VSGGFGVGVSIAARSVKLHLGELKALNRPDGGTTIQMRLPCVSVKVTSSQLQGA